MRTVTTGCGSSEVSHERKGCQAGERPLKWTNWETVASVSLDME